jgi:nitrate/TMAO reductase-like tetraheme cytochrome c subunit
VCICHDEFMLWHKRLHLKDGGYWACRIKHRESQRKYKLAHTYKITENEYLTMLVLQNSQCAICKKDFVQGEACIDHNHNTGEARGLLCKNCNKGLGFLQDDAKVLSKAVDYLESY